MATSLRNSTLDAALRFIPTHSFTRQAIKEGYLIARRSSPGFPSKQTGQGNEEAEVDAAVDLIFGPGEAPGKALVEAWERKGLEDMIEGEKRTSASAVASSSSSSSTSAVGSTSEGHVPSVRGLKDRLRRRLEYSERTAGEGLVQAHALLQASTWGTSIPLPRTLGYMIDRVKGDWEGWEVYTPPTAGSSASATLSSNQQAGQGSGSTGSSLGKERQAHHIPLPVPPNPLRSLGYAWRIIDQAMYLDHLSKVDREEPGKVKRNTEERMEREREGEGLGWYKRRMGLSLIYLRAESVLMLPRNRHYISSGESPLDRATTTLDRLLEANARGQSMATPPLGARSSGPEGQRLKEAVEFGKFVYHSWGGLFRSRGWIR